MHHADQHDALLLDHDTRPPPSAESLRGLATVLKDLAEARAQNPHMGSRMTIAKATAGAAEDIHRRFPGLDQVCDDWEQLVHRHARVEADALGLRLCIESVKGLGVTVHRVRVLDPNDVEGTNHLPINLDDMRRRTAPWRLPLATPSQPDSIQDESPADQETQLVFSCSALPHLANKGNHERVADRPVLAIEIRMGLGRRPWASAGHVVNLATDTVIALGCTLVCDPDLDTHQDVRQGTMCAQRRLLADFLASGETAWRPFAARRYANVRRLPEALVARGWVVKDGDLAEWSWGDSAGPTVKLSVGPSLSLSRPGVPVPVSVRMMDGHLIVSCDSHWRYDDCTQIDWPTLFPSDPPAQAFYGDVGFVPLHECRVPTYYSEENSHFDAVAARQRERLVTMGLVSPLAISGRKARFLSRTPTNKEDTLLRTDGTQGDGDGGNDSRFGAHVLVDADASTMADAINAYVAQNMFGEYGPVDTDSGQRLHGGMCDDLLDQAVASGRLHVRLAHITGARHATAEAIVHVASSAPGVESHAIDQPHLVVNWRAKCIPTTTLPASGRGAHDLPPAVWAAALVQSDGRGSACVAISVPKALTRTLFKDDSDGEDTTEDFDAPHGFHPPRYAEVGTLEHDIEDGTTRWWRVLDRCMRADPGYPPDLHPALVAVLDMERGCGKRACFVPWAYCVGTTENPVDARSLASWIIDCIAEIFVALDNALDDMVNLGPEPLQDD
ncbi:RE XamI incomplete domain containing protein [Pandoravirus quercus]|uniref:RE XamI incomplete domain containing protein n=2 Tax=Pandoravirus TaxID=2060084 RepID=A0A2U7UAG6_9VIRU|nr:RE XamI incomplete domain containing protein [Pandoravirus quercus]AVK75375.1 RE XamI incomplete domain containing protein [Pandoravirus quercus]QBZ81553.1 RE XamI superfamily incomplete domain containing protein [Pandoravirus celtis]